jgi:hypothetical protein
MSKRKATAVRTPSGQLSRADAPERFNPACIRKMMDELQRKATNPNLGYEVGRLFMAGAINRDHLSVAMEYHELAYEWMAVHGIPSPNAKAQDIISAKGASLREIDSRKAESIKRKWEAAKHALGTDALADWLYDVVIRDEAAVTVAQKRMVVVALDALARHWGDRRRTA